MGQPELVMRQLANAAVRVPRRAVRVIKVKEGLKTGLRHDSESVMRVANNLSLDAM